jgi:hypothetical protein
MSSSRQRLTETSISKHQRVSSTETPEVIDNGLYIKPVVLVVTREIFLDISIQGSWRRLNGTEPSIYGPNASPHYALTADSFKSSRCVFKLSFHAGKTKL